MNTAPKPNRSFFSIAAWYAVIAALAAAAISGLGWLSFISDGDFAFHAMNFCFNAAMFVSITSAVASIVCLFGLRRHGWRVILWKSLVGFILSCLVFAAPGVVLLHVLFPH